MTNDDDTFGNRHKHTLYPVHPNVIGVGVVYSADI